MEVKIAECGQKVATTYVLASEASEALTRNAAEPVRTVQRRSFLAAL
jgi:hypothetical protein